MYTLAALIHACNRRNAEVSRIGKSDETRHGLTQRQWTSAIKAQSLDHDGRPERRTSARLILIVSPVTAMRQMGNGSMRHITIRLEDDRFDDMPAFLFELIGHRLWSLTDPRAHVSEIEVTVPEPQKTVQPVISAAA